MNLKAEFKKAKGITLIALVVTIIVLLLLAGISITMLTGQNGILNRATEAKEETTRSQAEEKVKLAIMESYGEDGNIVLETLITNLNKIGTVKNDSFPVSVEVDGYMFTIAQSGKITLGNENNDKISEELLADLQANPTKYLEKAKNEKGQTKVDVVGIGTDGKVVNMDFWRWDLAKDQSGVSLQHYYYKYNGDSNIEYYDETTFVQGKMPQYVIYFGNNINFYGETMKVYKVTELDGTFSGENLMNKAPEIPSTVTTIGDSAFERCTGLTSINIPNSVTEIGMYAFRGCTGLTNINLPNSVTTIGEYAFSGCTGLTSINIPDSVNEIGRGVFEGCTGLTSINIPNSVTTIENGAFGDCTGLTSINIPNSVTEIGMYAFRGCTGLTSINISNAITKIDWYSFEYNKKLTNVAIPNSVITIGAGAFKDCIKLTNVNIPNSVTTIEAHAFEGCTGIESINIPSSVTTIQSNAFGGWTSSQNINCEKSEEEANYDSNWYTGNPQIHWGVSIK